MHQQFLTGVAVAGIDVGECYGSPEGRKYFCFLQRSDCQRHFALKRACLAEAVADYGLVVVPFATLIKLLESLEFIPSLI